MHAVSAWYENLGFAVIQALLIEWGFFIFEEGCFQQQAKVEGVRGCSTLETSTI